MLTGWLSLFLGDRQGQGKQGWEPYLYRRQTLLRGYIPVEGGLPPIWVGIGGQWCWLLYGVQHFAEGGNVFGAELAKYISLTVVSYFP